MKKQEPFIIVVINELDSIQKCVLFHKNKQQPNSKTIILNNYGSDSGIKISYGYAIARYDEILELFKVTPVSIGLTTVYSRNEQLAMPISIKKIVGDNSSTKSIELDNQCYGCSQTTAIKTTENELIFNVLPKTTLVIKFYPSLQTSKK